METEKKVPGTKVKPTAEEVAKIYASYAFGEAQVEVTGGLIRIPRGVGEYMGRYHLCNQYGKLTNALEYSILLVKPLGRISSEEAEFIAKTVYPDAPAMQTAEVGKMYLTDVITELYGVWLIDFLRERGYALPYKNWSVKELEEFGIYKLIE